MSLAKFVDNDGLVYGVGEIKDGITLNAFEHFVLELDTEVAGLRGASERADALEAETKQQAEQIEGLEDFLSMAKSRMDELEAENQRLKEREKYLIGVLRHIEVKCIDYDGYTDITGLKALIDTIKEIAEEEVSLAAQPQKGIKR